MSEATAASERARAASEARWSRPQSDGSGHELDEIDIEILKVLPEQGAKVSRLMPDAPTASEIKRKLGDPEIRGNLIGSRLGLMRKDGLVVPMKPPRSGGAKGWQRTEKGKNEVARAAEGGTAG